MTKTHASSTTPAPEIVLRHAEEGTDLAFAKALAVVEALDEEPTRWELRDEGVWHHGDHRIFHNSDEISIQPKHGSALIVVTFPKGAWRGPAHGTRRILDALRMVAGRGDDADQHALADEWCIAAFSTTSATGHSPKRVAMATPWEPAAWDPIGRGGHGQAIGRVLEACPTALRWEGHFDDGLPHVRIDQIDWTALSQEDLSPDPMEVLRAMTSIDRRIETAAREGRT